jgi:hypothetical protein
MLGGSILAVKPISHGLTFGHSTLEKKKKKKCFRACFAQIEDDSRN